MTDITLSEALTSLCPTSDWAVLDETLIWNDVNNPQPTAAEINAEVARLQAEYDAKAYQRSRASEYPPIGDQLDALFHAGVFPAEMAALIQAVKNKYPKDNS